MIDLTRYVVNVHGFGGLLALWCVDCTPNPGDDTPPFWTEDDAAEQVTELCLANLVAIAEQHEREHHDQSLIGPLTAEEWAAFRQTGDDEDLLQCCSITSEFRDALFTVLRMGAGKRIGTLLLHDAWQAMERHDFPDDVPQIEKLRAFYFPAEEPAK